MFNSKNCYDDNQNDSHGTAVKLCVNKLDDVV